MFYFVKVTFESDKLSKVDCSHYMYKVRAKVDLCRQLSKETFQCEKGLTAGKSQLACSLLMLKSVNVHKC